MLIIDVCEAPWIACWWNVLDQWIYLAARQTAYPVKTGPSRLILSKQGLGNGSECIELYFHTEIVMKGDRSSAAAIVLTCHTCEALVEVFVQLFETFWKNIMSLKTFSSRVLFKVLNHGLAAAAVGCSSVRGYYILKKPTLRGPGRGAHIRVVDLRSDVMTQPGPALRQAMAKAALEDDLMKGEEKICGKSQSNWHIYELQKLTLVFKAPAIHSGTRCFEATFQKNYIFFVRWL